MAASAARCGDRQRGPVKRTVGLAECAAEIVAVGAGEVLGTIKRRPADVGDADDRESQA